MAAIEIFLLLEVAVCHVQKSKIERLERRDQAYLQFKKGGIFGLIGFGTTNNDFLLNPGANNTTLQYNGVTKLTVKTDVVDAPNLVASTKLTVGQATVDATASLLVVGGIRTRGGALASGGTANNGYAFSGNGGDNDSGMFSEEDGEVSLWSNGIEKLKVRNDGVFVNFDNVGNQVNVQWNQATQELGYETSSRPIKENITLLEEDFSKILDLQSVKYTRPGRPDHWELGLIAEQAEEVGLKPLVVYDTEGKVLSFDYDRTVTYILPVLRAQRAQLEQRKTDLSATIEEIAALQLKNEKVQQQNDGLRSDLNGIESRLLKLENGAMGTAQK